MTPANDSPQRARLACGGRSSPALGGGDVAEGDGGGPGSPPAPDSFFASRGWAPFEFQREAWNAYLNGESGLIHAATGVGKTYAAWLGPLIEARGGTASPGGTAFQAVPLDDRPQENSRKNSANYAKANPRHSSERCATRSLRVLWLTPLRALAADTTRALIEPLDHFQLPWRVEMRTGDTSSSVKARQRKSMPHALVTTPESLTILLSYADSPTLFRNLRCIVVDEWHELIGSKRGVQAELALARLRTIAPGVRTWGLSATLGNTDEAARTLLGVGPNAPTPRLIRGIESKRIEVETILPDHVDRYPWAGRLGLALLDRVLERIGRARTTLVFTNTRSQAELWFRAIVRARHDWLGRVALHHGSLDRDLRGEVESMLRPDANGDARAKCVVCTSSLDLGVDFAPVEQVIQIGSPRGVARLVQRAGRSGHAPGQVSRVVCVPTHAFELVEFAAARDAIERGIVEARVPVEKPLDVLSQHIVTCAMGGGFDERRLLDEVRTTYAYRDLTDDEWAWAMRFTHQGGPALTAYPRYARIASTDDIERPRWTVASRSIATNHRMAIGTIVGESALKVQYVSGKVLGTIEEPFITRLAYGDRFVFAGRVLEFVRVRDMTAFVRRANRVTGAVPRWNGGRMPLSSQLAEAVLERLAHASGQPDPTLGQASGLSDPSLEGPASSMTLLPPGGRASSPLPAPLEGRASSPFGEAPEMRAVQPLLARQQATSRLPVPGELLIERVRTREGHHAFLFPFAGRLAHEGLGAVLSYRLSRRDARSVRAVVNDYGIELLSDEPFDLDEQGWRDLLTPDDLVDDLLASLDATQLAKRQFREIARIAGLTHQGMPGRPTPARQLQASAEMFFDVFTEFDPGNLLLEQSRREVLEGQLEVRRIIDVLERVSQLPIAIERPERLTPMAFPLWAESLRATTVSSRTWEDRVRRMAVRLAGAPSG